MKKDSLTSMRPAVRTDISESHHINLLQSLHKAAKPRLPDVTDGDQQDPQARRNDNRQRIQAHVALGRVQVLKEPSRKAGNVA